MIEFIYCLLATNILSAALSVRLYLKLKSVKARPESIEAEELLMDLLSGSALVKITRVSPSDVVLRNRRK